MKNQAPVKNQWAVLGFLRLLFASVVFFTHVGAFVNLPSPLGDFWQLGPYAAVLGFFVISGYSIAHSIAKEPKGFYERRLTRLYPLYFLSLVLACIPFAIWGPVVNTANGGGTEAPLSVWPVVGNFFFLQGFAVHRFSGNGPIWSLSCEMFYYMLAPILVRLSSRSVAVIAAVSAFAYYFHAHFRVAEFTDSLFGIGPLSLLWAWLFGFLLYRHPGNRLMQFVVVAGGALMLSRFDQFAIAHYSVFLFVAGTMLISQAHQIALSESWTKIGIYAGELSYPLYILHFPLVLLLFGGSRQVTWWIAVPILLGVVMLAYHFVDMPYQHYARALRRRKQISLQEMPALAGVERNK